MNTNVYIVNFLVNSANLHDFEEFLRTSTIVRGYWNYIPLCYCFRCDYDIHNVTKIVGEYFPSGNFMVAKLDPFQVNGVLPKGAWDWFYHPPENRQLGLFSFPLPKFPL